MTPGSMLKHPLEDGNQSTRSWALVSGNRSPKHPIVEELVLLVGTLFAIHGKINCPDTLP